MPSRNGSSSVGMEGGNGNGTDPLLPPIPFELAAIPPQDIYAKIVERCGDRKLLGELGKGCRRYFSSESLSELKNLLDNPDNDVLHDWFQRIPRRGARCNKSIGLLGTTQLI